MPFGYHHLDHLAPQAREGTPVILVPAHDIVELLPIAFLPKNGELIHQVLPHLDISHFCASVSTVFHSRKLKRHRPAVQDICTSIHYTIQ